MNILVLEDDLILSAELCTFLESNDLICDKIYNGETCPCQIKRKSFIQIKYLQRFILRSINGKNDYTITSAFDTHGKLKLYFLIYLDYDL